MQRTAYTLMPTNSILTESHRQQCKRPPSAMQKMAFQHTIDGLSQAKLPPFIPHFTACAITFKRKTLILKLL